MKPLHNVKTEAIFSVDDDIHVLRKTLKFAFETWLSAPFSMVGFVPRMHWKVKQVSFLFYLLFSNQIYPY
jgi:Glycosyl transferase family 64 domain